MKSIRLFKLNNRVMGKYFFVFGLLIIIMSCGKDIDQFVPRPTQDTNGDINRLLSRLQTDIAGDVFTTVSCPCSGDAVFKIDKDLVLVVPQGFVNLAQFPCSNGYFDINVTVCDTKGEILISGLPTVSEHTLLESRIELNLQILDGSTPVKLAHGKQIRILVNDPDPRERMELFYGDYDRWIQADNNKDTWENVANSEWWIQLDSSQITGFGYECFSDSLDWINVDVFFEIPNDHRTTVCVDLPEGFTNKNTSVYMVFDDYKSLLWMPGDSSTQQFCEPYGATPVGFHATFVVVSEIGIGSYMFAAQKAIITPGHIETIAPKNTPYEEILSYMKEL
jgi:hypothetical protein